MKVLLTGATGFLGSEIARELVRQGHELRVLVRKTSKLDNLAGLTFEKHEGDITDKASVERALVGVDALIHAAASVGQRRRDKDTLYRVNVEGTRNVLEAAKARGGLRVVYTSSIAAVGANPTPIVQNEESPWAGGGLEYHYVESKRQAEDVAFSFAKGGLDVVIVNPGFILGPNDIYGSSTKFVLEYLKGNLHFVTPGGISYCDVRDVAKAHVAALTKGKPGERYILAGQNLTYHEALSIAGRVAGLKAPVRVPYAIAWLLASTLEAASLVAEHRFEDLNRPVVRYSVLYNYCDPSKAKRELGYELRPVEESMRDTIADFLARGLHGPVTPELRAIATSGAKAAAPARKPELQAV